MLKDLPFNDHVQEYEAWFDKYPFVFQTELAAIRQLWPGGTNLVSLELGSACGHFAQALRITEGLEPFVNMNEAAEKKKVRTICGIAESLPYAPNQFDVVLANCSIHYFFKPHLVLEEAHRVLKQGGCIIIAFIDRESVLGKHYLEKKEKGTLFHKQAHDYSVEQIEKMVTAAGFRNIETHQTIFGLLENVQTVQALKPGTGTGSYILIKAYK